MNTINIAALQTMSDADVMAMTTPDLANTFGAEFARMRGFAQNNPHHCYDLLRHTMETFRQVDIEGLSTQAGNELRIAALYHDVGKPDVAMQKNGRTVFYGHADASRKIAAEILADVLEGDSLSRVLFYIEQHDAFISFKETAPEGHKYIQVINPQTVMKAVTRIQRKAAEQGKYVPSIEDFKRMLRLCMADAAAQAEEVYMDGKLVDSRADKIKRLKAILACL